MQVSSLSNGFWGDQENFNLTAHLKRKTEHAPHKQSPMQAIAAQMAAEEAKKNEPAPSIAGVSDTLSRSFVEAAQEAPAPLSVHWAQPETTAPPQAELPSLLDALKIEDSEAENPLKAMQEQLEQAAEEALQSSAQGDGFLSAPQMAQVADSAPSSPAPARTARPAAAYSAIAKATAPQEEPASEAVAVKV